MIDIVGARERWGGVGGFVGKDRIDLPPRNFTLGIEVTQEPGGKKFRSQDLALDTNC